MKTKTAKLILLLAAGVVLAVPAVVLAQAPPAATPAGGSLEQRLAQRKAERNVALDDKTQKRLVSTCTKGQGKVRTLQQTTTDKLAERTKLYQQMDGKLWVVIGKLKLAEKDTFALEKQKATLAEKSAAVQATSALYQQSLDDLALVNCQADPIGFKAMLDTSRLYHKQLRDQSADIRNYVINDIKPALSKQASEMQAN